MTRERRAAGAGAVGLRSHVVSRRRGARKCPPRFPTRGAGPQCAAHPLRSGSSPTTAIPAATRQRRTRRASEGCAHGRALATAPAHGRQHTGASPPRRGPAPRQVLQPQQPLLSLGLFCRPLTFTLPDGPSAGMVWLSILFLISVAMVRKAVSTLLALLAEVSRKGMRFLSANSLAASKRTWRASPMARSDLLPTSNLDTFSRAYLLISTSQSFTLSNEFLLVTSYTTMMPWAPR
mmetsp:Transcript_23772/g.70044  ORF Transcript_23772/g.70044 Transcript_23772/m.70044 type:complete len:235 (+) Transcript_23772:130-834(+)